MTNEFLPETSLAVKADENYNRWVEELERKHKEFFDTKPSFEPNNLLAWKSLSEDMLEHLHQLYMRQLLDEFSL